MGKGEEGCPGPTRGFVAVVEVQWDARERHSPTSKLRLKAFPHVRLL